MGESYISNVYPEGVRVGEVRIVVVAADDVPELADGVIQRSEPRWAERVDPGTKDQWGAEDRKVERGASWGSCWIGVPGVAWIALESVGCE